MPRRAHERSTSTVYGGHRRRRRGRRPNIGPLAALPGLYLATHFCSGGFGYHPVAGLLLAEYIIDGQTRIDASEFSPDRFADFDTDRYLSQDITHHAMIDAHASRSRGFVRKRH